MRVLGHILHHAGHIIYFPVYIFQRLAQVRFITPEKFNGG